MKPLNKSELNQISLTGVRAIALLGLLMVAPRSFKEIKEIFIALNIMTESRSLDILRVDMNTLKAIGCDISRSSQKTGNKFVLLKHPFTFDISIEDVKLLNKVYKQIKNVSSIKTLFMYDAMFKKIAFYTENPAVKEELYGISVFKNYEIDKIEDIIRDYEQNNILKLEYKNPSYRTTTIKEIAIENISYQNGNILIQGYDFRKEGITTLNFKRIISIISRRKGEKNYDVNGIKVKFHLTDFGIDTLSENEEIVEMTQNGYIIEGTYLTEFSMAQRILSFGEKCTIIEPESCKTIIINKLKEMRGIYDN